MFKKWNILGIGILLSVGLLFAQEDTGKADWEKMTIEEALKQIIVTAGKRAEKISRVPATVTVLTSQKLRELGVDNVLEALSYVPGVFIQDTYWRDPIVTVRGIFESLYNDKILLLINGIPAFEAVNGASYFECIPIDAIERIEVVRGPGSTLYGTNAFSAVINVIMKTGKIQDGVSVSEGYGSFHEVRTGVNFGKETGDFDIFVGGTYSDNDGYTKDVKYDERTDTWGDKDTSPLNYENDIMNAYGSLTYKGLKVFANVFHQKENKFGMVPILGWGGPAQHSMINFATQYVRKLTDNLSLTTSFRYNWMNRYTRVGGYGPDDHPYWDTGFFMGDHSQYRGKVYNIDTYLEYKIMEDLSLLGGVYYEGYSPQNLYTVWKADSGIMTNKGSSPYPPPSVSDHAAYLQLSWTVKNISVIGGLRYVNLGEDVGEFITPRGGLVVNFIKDGYLRINYGEAFRAPSIYERYMDCPGVLVGVSTLKPERVRTAEVGVEYLIMKLVSAKVTGFYSNISDLIARRPHTPTGMEYFNKEKGQYTYGLEAEMRTRIKSFVPFANFSYTYGYDREIEDEIMYLPHVLAHCGFTYTPLKHLSISPNVLYVGKKEGKLGAGAKPWVGEPGDKVTVAPYTLLNLVLSFNPIEHLEIHFIGKNLLDTEYEYPEHLRRKIDVIPGGPGRSFYVGIRWGDKVR